MKSSQSLEASALVTRLQALVTRLQGSIWTLGILFWIFGIADRGAAIYADGYVSAVEFSQLLIPSFLFLGWLYLKPERSLTSENLQKLQSYKEQSASHQDSIYFLAAQSRMLELQEQHQISQRYTLYIPYICQIYHLLNLKHLETVHSLSLSNLRVINVSDIKTTAIGGAIKFQTILNSSINALRIWRQPVVEVDLILHSPYTIELSIPVYAGKRITVIFNVIPLDRNKHELLIDIYSDLRWPKFLLQVLFHFAASLTLFEDLPYLHKLAERRLYRSVKAVSSNRQTMWLFGRFVDLYGSAIELTAQPEPDSPQIGSQTVQGAIGPASSG